MAKRQCQWFVEPLGNRANELIVDQLDGWASVVEQRGVKDSRGITRNLYAVDYSVIRSIEIGSFKDQFRIFRKTGINGKIEAFSLGKLKQQTQKRRTVRSLQRG